MTLKLLLATAAIVATSACAPKVYVIDRQTVFEEEAAGQWPQFDKELLEKSKAPTPTAFSKVPTNDRRKRLYNTLNGEMISTAVADQAPQTPSTGSAK